MIRKFQSKTYQSTERIAKLYELSKESVVSHAEDPDVLFLFSHIDGAYSCCKTADDLLYHPAAWSEVIIWEETHPVVSKT